MPPLFLNHELYLIYNPDTELGRKVRALAPSISSVVHEIDVRSKWVTPFRWKEIVNLLDLSSVKELINTSHPDYEKALGGKDFSERDLLEILYQDPQLVKGPIGVLRDRAVLCNNSADILLLDSSIPAEKDSFEA